MVSLTLFEIGKRSDPIRHDTTRHDATRPNYPSFFHSTAAIVSCTIHSVLLYERLEKVSDNNRN